MNDSMRDSQELIKDLGKPYMEIDDTIIDQY